MKTEEKFLLGALIGSAIGAATALLFAPVPGVSLRKRIMNKIYRPLELPKQKRRAHSVRGSRSRPKSNLRRKHPIPHPKASPKVAMKTARTHSHKPTKKVEE